MRLAERLGSSLGRGGSGGLDAGRRTTDSAPLGAAQTTPTQLNTPTDRLYLHRSPHMASVTLPPPLSLLGLPPEVKVEIVKLVRLQYLGYFERFRERSGQEREIIELVHSEWLGRGVKALSLVNQELNGLAEEHIFEVGLLSFSADPMESER